MNTREKETRDTLAALQAIGAKNAPATAEKLIDAFGTFSNIIEARPEALQAITTPTIAARLSSLLPVFRSYIAARDDAREITNRHKLESYCLSLFMGERVEKFAVICVNSRCIETGVRIISTGSLSEVSAYPRLVMETALNYNAHSVFFCHNHPGGTAAPSREDIISTQQLADMLRKVGIQVLDHLIVCGNKTYSMVANGDFR